MTKTRLSSDQKKIRYQPFAADNGFCFCWGSSIIPLSTVCLPDDENAADKDENKENVNNGNYVCH